MIEAEPPPSEAPEPSRVNRAFAGVGAAMGLFVWLNLFALPLALTSVVVLKSHPRAGLFLGCLAQLCGVLGTLWVARSRWGPSWRKALPLQPLDAGTLAWVALWTLGVLLPVIAAYAGLDRAFGLPGIRDPKLVVGGLGVVLGAPLAGPRGPCAQQRHHARPDQPGPPGLTGIQTGALAADPWRGRDGAGSASRAMGGAGALPG